MRRKIYAIQETVTQTMPDIVKHAILCDLYERACDARKKLHRIMGKIPDDGRLVHKEIFRDMGYARFHRVDRSVHWEYRLEIIPYGLVSYGGQKEKGRCRNRK